MNTTAEAPRDLAAIEADIARTRASLNRKLQALEQRLSPSERMAQVKATLDPRPHPEWIAVAAVVVGSALALAGWRRSRQRAFHDDDLEDVVIFDVCEDDTLA